MAAMQYFLSSEGRHLGVFSLEELKAMKAAGQAPAGAWAWREGMTEWQPLDTILAAHDTTRRRRKVWLIAGVVLAVLGVGSLTLLVLAAPMLASRLRAARLARAGDSSAQMLIAGKPIVHKTNSLTETLINERSKQFRVRQYLEAYKARGERDASYDDDALRMIQGWIDSNYGGSASKTENEASALAEKLAANPKCKDVLLLAVAASTGAADAQAVTARLERAVENAANSQHLGYPKLYATVRLATMVRDTGRVRALDRTALKYLMEALQDGGLVDDDQQELAEILANGWGKAFFTRNGLEVCRLCTDVGKPFQWLALALRGEYEVKAAWKARGSGYVDSVSDKGWQGFATHSAAARQHFTRAWELHPDWPMAPACMVYVAMGDSDLGEMRLWFDRATEAQVDSEPAWHNMFWGLRPRWHGNLEAIKALGYAAVDTGRFDTDVPRKYFDAITAIESELELPAGQRLFNRPDIWPRLQKMYEGYVAHPSQARFQKGWRTSYCVVSYLAGRHDLARQQMDALDWQPVSLHLDGWGKDLSLLPGEIAARTGPAGKEITAAESAYAKADTRAAAARYHDLKGRSELDEHATRFIQSRLATLELETSFADAEGADQWTDIMPKNIEDPAWVSVKGTWKAAPRRLEVSPDQQGHLGYSRLRVGTNFKVRGEFDLLNGPKDTFQGGIVMGLPSWTGSGWFAFRILKNGDASHACFTSGWNGREIYEPVPLKEAGNVFEFTLHGWKISATVNGKEVFVETPVSPPRNVSEREFYVGFIGYEPKDAAICYRNVEVRKLQNLR